jgi:ABC-type transporter Mla MlaB component
MKSPVPAVERDGRSATVRLHGDLVVPTARVLYSKLRAVARRRDVKRLTLDFSDVGRIDSSGVAIISLIGRLLEHGGKHLDLTKLQDQHKAALALAPDAKRTRGEPIEDPGTLEWLGDRVLDLRDSMRSFGELAADTVRQLSRVITRRARMPAGALRHHIESMGFNAIFIVALL